MIKTLETGVVDGSKIFQLTIILFSFEATLIVLCNFHDGLDKLLSIRLSLKSDL